MSFFGNLSEKLNNIFGKLRSKGRLSEADIKQAMREIRVALLEADVNNGVVKQFIEEKKKKAAGEDIMKSLTPGQQVVKIVNDELIALMGGTNSKLEVSPKPPTVIMMCGLQGAGKTTMCGKLAMHLIKQGKKPLLCACDIYRPAAINQLKVVGKSVGAEVFERGTQSPVKTARQAIEYAEKNAFSTVIIDTAGRLHIDETLMEELREIKEQTHPAEILLVVDAMTGQDSVNVAQSFDSSLDITGVILTKLDGDTRGGAALSIKAVTGKPIKFCGIGEKPGDLEPFYPDRMASRILGMGDVLTLIEKAQEAVSEQQLKEMEKRLKEAKFSLDDFLTQFESIKKMGGIKDVLGMMPGMGNMKIRDGDIDESMIERYKAIICSMTKKERDNPEIIKSSRRKRIAQGSGTSIQQVNQLLKQFEQSKQMMKSMKSNKKFRLPF